MSRRLAGGRLLPYAFAAALVFQMLPLASGVARADVGDWTEFRFGPTHTGFNANETTIGVSNAPTLVTRWEAPAGSPIYSSPAVANGVAYVGTLGNNLYAFDASGAVNCSGAPPTCQPLWTATTGNQISSSPAVANGVVYVGS